MPFSFSILVSSVYMSRSGIAESYCGFIPSFFLKESSYQSSIVAASTYIPTKSARVFPFLHILSRINFFVDFLRRAILTCVR